MTNQRWNEGASSTYELILTIDWNQFSGGHSPPFTGRFAKTEWSYMGSPPYPDYIAACLKLGDTVSITIQDSGTVPSPSPLSLNQCVLIFTKDAGAAEEPCSPFRWHNPITDTDSVLGMIAFTPSRSHGDPTSLPWHSDSCSKTHPHTPPGTGHLIVAGNSISSFQITLCAEIYDDQGNRGFYTHDPTMDVDP